MTRSFTLCDEIVTCEYDDETGELLELSDWNGNGVSYRVEREALEIVSERMAAKKRASA